MISPIPNRVGIRTGTCQKSETNPIGIHFYRAVGVYPNGTLFCSLETSAAAVLCTAPEPVPPQCESHPQMPASSSAGSNPHWRWQKRPAFSSLRHPALIAGRLQRPTASASKGECAGRGGCPDRRDAGFRKINPPAWLTPP